jgi:hypothetical protein
VSLSGSLSEPSWPRNAALNIYETATYPMQLRQMFRAMAVGLAALLLLDRYLFDGRYIDTVVAMARSLIHFVIG